MNGSRKAAEFNTIGAKLSTGVAEVAYGSIPSRQQSTSMFASGWIADIW
jgi:hypothetical protein